MSTLTGSKKRQLTYTRPSTLLGVRTHYCAGCGHGIVHKLIAEIAEEKGLRDRLVGTAPVGCAVLSYCYLDFDSSEAAHGRTPAVCTGIKRVHPDCIVYSYQGDGDLAAIGTAEIIHAANRGENITVIFINNAVYGMTQGQMAPTTMLGQVTSTTPAGRDKVTHGNPLHVCELLSQLDGAAYLTRVTVSSPKAIRATKRAIERAFQCQDEKRGFSLVEVLSPCPTYWRMAPAEAMKFIDEEMVKTFPLGTMKDWEEE